MKASKFNTFFTDNEQQIGHNSYTNEFIMLDSLLYELYTVGLKKNNFTELQLIHPEFYTFLIQKGFLVESELDEFEFIKGKSIEIDNNNSEFELIVNPTMNCNFKCWYCYETHIKDSKMDETTKQSIVRLVENVLKNQKGIQLFKLSFFGGEPLLYFDKVIKPILIEVFNLCQENDVAFHSAMTTNGLLLNQDILDICKKYSLTGFQITLDGNESQHNKIRFISEKKGSYLQIVDNIISVARNKLFAHVRINCSLDTMSNINEIIDAFECLTEEERYYINFDLQRVWQETSDIQEMMSNSRFFFKEKGFSVSGISANTSESVMSSCYADKRYQATVNYNGEVFKCTARDFTKNSGEGILSEDGVIIWNNKYEERLNSKFKNAPCKECRILPMCGGGCTQQALENNGNDYCVYGFDENAKTQTIINKFKALIG